MAELPDTLGLQSDLKASIILVDDNPANLLSLRSLLEVLGQMPGMDGYEVARRVRKTPGLEKTILAALTGWGQQEDRHRTAEAGFDHHLVKPPEPQAVEAVLAALRNRTKDAVRYAGADAATHIYRR